MAIRSTLHRASDQRGFTLVEVTIILLVLVVLSMILLPQLGHFNRLARKVKVFEDIGVICSVLKMWVDDIGVNGPYQEPGGTGQGPGGNGVLATANNDKTGGRVGLLVGDGSIPAVLASLDDSAKNSLTGANGTWVATTAQDFTGPTDVLTAGGVDTVGFLVDEFKNHIIMNDPDGNTAGLTGRYKNLADSPTISIFTGWHGPYINEVSADPYGNRYAANTFGLHFAIDGDTYSTAVVCLSAGPNGIVETKMNQPMAVAPTGWVTGGDDIVAILSSFGPF